MSIRGAGPGVGGTPAGVAVLAVMALVALGTLTRPSGASARGRQSRALYYETESSTGVLTIDRLTLTGPRVRTTVVDVGNVGVFGIALGAGSVYWVTEAGPHDRGAIMRASLDGRHVRRLVGGLSAPDSLIAVAGSLYWSDDNAIGRVAFNGTRLRRRFLVLPPERGGGVADGLASDGTHLYFSRCSDDTIGRAGLTGGPATERFISTGRKSCPQGLAVAGRRLYWTQLGAGTIGRAGLDGRRANGRWLRIHSHQGPFQVVADSAHIYWTWGGVDGSPAYTARSDIDGSHLHLRFLAGSLYPMALSAAA